MKTVLIRPAEIPTQSKSSGIDIALSAKTKLRIEEEYKKYPADQRRSAVMAALRFAQEDHQWLSSAVIAAVAKEMQLEPMAVYEVASFYNMYDLKPVGKYKITVCTNLPCALSGGVHCAHYLQEKLGIGFNETTADGLFTLKEGECLGACGDAPVLLVNNVHMRSFMAPEAIEKMLQQLTKEAD